MTADQLRARFSGDLLLPDHADYETQRRVHNGLIDRRPAMIARCRSTADVVAALAHARQHGLDITVRGGGHNVAGRAVGDGALMIDLSAMRAVTVDTGARTATAEGGATWADFNKATQAHGLATTGGVISTTGVAGLTLGGGLGWLMGLYGLAIDNLLSVELVTAEGKVITADLGYEPELFWALRGGGGNFGIATRLTFQLHALREVLGGLVVHPLDRGPELLRFYRERATTAPDALTLFAGLMHAPDGSGNKISAIVACHADARAGAADLAPVKAWGPPLMDVIGPMTYEAVNSMLDGGFPKGALNYWKSGFLRELTDEAIDTMVDVFRRCPAPMGGMLLERFHGRVTHVSPTATAFPHRSAGYNLLILGQWMDAGQSDTCISWARDAYRAMSPFMGAGRYVNYLADDEGSDAVSSAYGPNHARLARVKHHWDPHNVFHQNQNIVPAVG